MKTDNILQFNCPHCNHNYSDELELLDSDELHAFKCESCNKEFTVLVKECLACLTETQFVSSDTQQITTSPMHCKSCGKVI